MPIRFYCVFCNKQLGIATRKAGAVVTCPNCKQKLRVPVPEEKKADPPGSVPFRTERPPAGGAAVSTVAPRSADPGSRPSGVGGNPVRAVPTPRMPPGQLFEQSDFDEFLRQQAPPRPAPAAGSPGDAGMELELEPLPPADLPPEPPLTLTPEERRRLAGGKAAAIVLVVSVAVLAFAAGFFVGQWTADGGTGSPPASQPAPEPGPKAS